MPLYAKPILKETREKSYTQSELAELLRIKTSSQISRSSYSLIESGADPVTPENATVIARILKVPLPELFVEEPFRKKKDEAHGTK